MFPGISEEKSFYEREGNFFRFLFNGLQNSCSPLFWMHLFVHYICFFFIKQGLIFASKKVGGQSVSFVFSGEKLFFCFLLQLFELCFPGKDFFKTKFRLHLEEGVRDDDDRKCQLSYFLRDQNLPRHPNPKCPNRR